MAVAVVAVAAKRTVSAIRFDLVGGGVDLGFGFILMTAFFV